jgi:putative ABC transport system substrate-binding protein
MKRRAFIAGIGSAATWPLVARGQQTGKIIHIGILGPSLNNPLVAAAHESLRTRLRTLGFTEGQQIALEYRNVDDPRGPFVVADELLQSQPDLIVAEGPEVALRAVASLTHTIPIVMIAINFDPIARGYVKSLAEPGGNITGVVYQQLELAQKQVELLTQAFPEKTRLDVLFDALSADQFSAAERVTKSLGVQIQAQKLDNPPYDFEGAFNNMAASGAQMVLVLSSPQFTLHASLISEMGIRHRLPTMFIVRYYVEAGGLMSYGANWFLTYRKCADYVARILRGANPAELPVEQAEKFELVVNLKTAKAIGVTIPTGILIRADEVIE